MNECERVDLDSPNGPGEAGGLNGVADELRLGRLATAGLGENDGAAAEGAQRDAVGDKATGED